MAEIRVNDIKLIERDTCGQNGMQIPSVALQIRFNISGHIFEYWT